MTDRNQQGFALLEVIAIVAMVILLGLFAYFSTFSLNSKARDAKRRSDFQLIVNSLDKYHQDNSSYPVCMALSDTQEWDDCLGSLDFVSYDPVNNSIFVYGYVGDSEEESPYLRINLERGVQQLDRYDEKLNRYYMLHVFE